MTFPVLDVPTLSVVLNLLYFANIVFSVLLYLNQQTFSGARLWILGQTMVSVGFLGVFFRPVLPTFFSIVVANTLLITSLVAYFHSIWVFRFQRTFPKLLYLIIPAVMVAFALSLGQTFNFRAVLYSILQGIGALAVSVLLVYKVEVPYRGSNFLTATPFFLIGVANLVRIPSNLIGPEIKDFNAQGDVNTLFYLLSIMTGAFTLFGYFMMNGVRFEQSLRHRDLEIEKRNQALIEVNRSKDLFFSIIAHDLRGPIGGAARYVRKHFLRKEASPEKWRNEVEVLAASLEKTHEFLEKLLWWSRIQQQTWQPSFEIIDPYQMIKDSVMVFLPDAANKGIELTLPEKPTDWKLLADKQSLEVILRNLISNALKFSSKGSVVRVECSRVKGSVRISVLDQGVGMSEEVLHSLFKIEAKRSTRGTSGELGSGIGLILSRELAERNGGRFEIESRQQVGTRVSLWLPASPE